MKNQFNAETRFSIARSISGRRMLILTTILAVTILFTVVAYGLSSGGGVKSTPDPANENGVSTASPVVSAQQQGPMEEVRIRLSTSGFDPAEITRVGGRFSILIENVNVEGEYTLVMKAEDGRVIKEVRVQKGSAGWADVLQPGRYTLSEAAHPGWVCQITVQ